MELRVGKKNGLKLAVTVFTVLAVSMINGLDANEFGSINVGDEVRIRTVVGKKIMGTVTRIRPGEYVSIKEKTYNKTPKPIILSWDEIADMQVAGLSRTTLFEKNGSGVGNQNNRLSSMPEREEKYAGLSYLLFSIHSVSAAYTAELRYLASYGNAINLPYAHVDKGLKYALEYATLIGPTITQKNFNERFYPAFFMGFEIGYAEFKAPAVVGFLDATPLTQIKKRDYLDLHLFKPGFGLKFPYGFVYSAVTFPLKLGLTEISTIEFFDYYIVPLVFEVELGLMFVFDRLLLGVKYRTIIADFTKTGSKSYYTNTPYYPVYLWKDKSGLHEEWSIALSVGVRLFP